MSKRVICKLIWIPSLVAIIAMIATFGQAKNAAPTAGPFVDYVTADKRITIKHPNNWKPQSRDSGATVSGVRFTPTDSVSFSVRGDLTGSLMADIARSPSSPTGGEQIPGMPAMTADARKTPLEKLHDGQAEEMAKDPHWTSFEDGTTTHTRISGAEALITDFTYQAPGNLTIQRMVGRRATILTTDRRVRIVFRCPADQQREIYPIFNKMLASLRLSQGE